MISISAKNNLKSMTPKEKAKELADKFKVPHPYQGLSKDYALIVVDEILLIIESEFENEWWINYWQEVKQEIEKL